MKINAQKRDVTGKKVKNLRAEGKVPGTVYGPKFESTNVVVDAKELRKAYKELGLTNFADVEIDGAKPVKVLIKEITIHPIKDNIEDVSFYAVDEDRKLTVAVPVIIHGEAPAVKLNLGFLMQQLNTITVHCLPKDLPHSIEVNINSLEKPGDSISVGSISLPENVELNSNMEATSAIVYIAAPQKEIVEEAVTPAADAAAAPAEGEAAAEVKEEDK
jgi:large subunit ribosomal protein L25